MAQQAQDTFVITLPDGTMRRITKGEVLSDRDDVVKRDQAGAGVLFKPLDLGDDEKPPAKSEPDPAEEAAPVKAPARAAKAAGKAGSGG
jgi:hypothetical protein